MPRHRGQVAEAVSDHQLGLAPRSDERRDRGGRVLAVGVDDEDCLGAAGHVVDARSDGGALAALPREAHELGAGLVGYCVELAGDVRVGPVVDDHDAGHVLEDLVDVRTLGDVAV